MKQLFRNFQNDGFNRQLPGERERQYSGYLVTHVPLIMLQCRRPTASDVRYLNNRT